MCDTRASKTRSSATAEKQRVSCACLPRLVNWPCNAQNTAESQRLYYFVTFKRSDSRSAGPKVQNGFWYSILQHCAGRKRIFTSNIHSRSFIFARDSIYAIARICYRPSVRLSVRLSVCPSHGWISQKRLKLGSCNFHPRVAPWL